MWEFATGNTFGALAFSSYGAFWLSFACIFIPFFDVAAAYTKPDELFAALGHYLICTFPQLCKVYLTCEAGLSSPSS